MNYMLSNSILRGHLKKCRSPGQEKCRKSASESAGVKRGAKESAEKSASGCSCRGSTDDGTQSTFFGTFPGTPFHAGTFRSTFSALFLAWGFGNSLDAKRKKPTQNPEIPEKRCLTRTFSKSSRGLLPSLWRESGTQPELFRKTYSHELFYLGCFFWVDFPPLNNYRKEFLKHKKRHAIMLSPMVRATSALW